MRARPVSSSGDILPVVSQADLLPEPAASAAALRDHLSLFPGDWWEFPSRGNPVLSLLPSARTTPQDAATLAACLSAYLESYPSVRAVTVRDASFDRHLFSFSAVAHLTSGVSVPVHFSAP